MSTAMEVKIEKQHEWLQQMVGEWTYEGECSMGEGEPPMKFEGTETVRSVGGLWIVAEGKGSMPDGSPATMILTVGYDPKRGRFVGSWIGSMMTHMWVYDGALDGAKKVLSLESEGPDCMGDGEMARFRDVVEITGKDTRLFSGGRVNADGSWSKFMTMRYTRVR